MKRRKQNNEDLIKTILTESAEEENPQTEASPSSFPPFPEEFEVVKAGNEGIRALRKKLQKEYRDEDHPAKNLLINAICKLYQYQRRASSPDALIKISGAIRASLLSLEQICGRNREKTFPPPPNPLESMTDAEIEERLAEFESILGKFPKQMALRENN